MRQKKTFKAIFLFLSVLLMVLPVMLTFNNVLTRLVEKFVLYVWLQERIVPLQTRLIGLTRPISMSMRRTFTIRK